MLRLKLQFKCLYSECCNQYLQSNGAINYLQSIFAINICNQNIWLLSQFLRNYQVANRLPLFRNEKPIKYSKFYWGINGQSRQNWDKSALGKRVGSNGWEREDEVGWTGGRWRHAGPAGGGALPFSVRKCKERRWNPQRLYIQKSRWNRLNGMTDVLISQEI